MDVKKVSGRYIPREKSIEMRRIAGPGRISIYMEKHYGAKPLPEMDSVINDDGTITFYIVWGFIDMEKYTEFCLTWM